MQAAGGRALTGHPPALFYTRFPILEMELGVMGRKPPEGPARGSGLAGRSPREDCDGYTHHRPTRPPATSTAADEEKGKAEAAPGTMGKSRQVLFLRRLESRLVGDSAAPLSVSLTGYCRFSSRLTPPRSKASQQDFYE